MSEQATSPGVGDSEMSKIVPSSVSVTSADQTPDPGYIGKTGSDFLGGSPAGREAQPTLKEGRLAKPSLP